MLTRNLQDETQQLSLTKNGRFLLEVQKDLRLEVYLTATHGGRGVSQRASLLGLEG